MLVFCVLSSGRNCWVGQERKSASANLLTCLSAHRSFTGLCLAVAFCEQRICWRRAPQLTRCGSGDAMSHAFSVNAHSLLEPDGFKARRVLYGGGNGDSHTSRVQPRAAIQHPSPHSSLLLTGAPRAGAGSSAPKAKPAATCFCKLSLMGSQPRPVTSCYLWLRCVLCYSRIGVASKA